MPLKRRQPTLKGAVRDVLLAPFALVFVQLYAFRWILAFGGACVLACWLLGGRSAASESCRPHRSAI